MSTTVNNNNILKYEFFTDSQSSSVNVSNNNNNVGNTSLLSGLADERAGVFSTPSDEQLVEMFEGSTTKYSTSYKNYSSKKIAHLKALLLGFATPKTTTKKTSGDTPAKSKEPINVPGVNPTTPTGTNDPEDLPDKPEGLTTYELVRKSSSSSRKTNISVPAEGICIKLTNNFAGSPAEITYKFTPVDGVSGTIKEISYLDNGRLYIKCDNLIIEATKGQDDDIILVGSRNVVNTNNGDDRVRVTDVRDSQGLTTGGTNNTINTGSGNDYVFITGFHNVDMGENIGDKDELVVAGSAESYKDIITLAAGVEKVTAGSGISQYDTDSDDLGHGMQGQWGSCKYLSFLNSLKLYLSRPTTTETLEDYATFEVSEDQLTVTVKFTKSGKSIELDSNDLNNSKNVDGDWKFVLMEVAFRKIINKNGGFLIGSSTNPKEFGKGGNNYLLNEYLYGSEYHGKTKAGAIIKEHETTESFETAFTNLFNKYNAGELTNLVVGMGVDNEKIGIISNHAYAIKDAKVGQWVEVINPWEGGDSIKLDWEDFFSYCSDIILFGDTFEAAKTSGAEKVFWCGDNGGVVWTGTSSDGDQIVETVYDNIFEDKEIEEEVA